MKGGDAGQRRDSTKEQTLLYSSNKDIVYHHCQRASALHMLVTYGPSHESWPKGMKWRRWMHPKTGLERSPSSAVQTLASTCTYTRDSSTTIVLYLLHDMHAHRHNHTRTHAHIHLNHLHLCPAVPQPPGTSSPAPRGAAPGTLCGLAAAAACQPRQLATTHSA